MRALLLTALVVIACRAGREVGPSGGTVVSSDGVATLEVPADALEQSVSLSLLAASQAPAGSLISPYAIEPSGTVFKKPVLLVLSSPQLVESSEGVPRLVVEENGAWLPFSSGTFSADEHVVSARLEHLSTYGVIREPARRDGQVCQCRPEDVAVCCGHGHATYLAPCSCAYDPQQPYSDYWASLDCTIDAGMVLTTSYGECALECCRDVPGLAWWTNGNDVVCYSKSDWRPFDDCVQRNCPAREAPRCPSGAGGGSGGTGGGGGAGGGGVVGGPPCSANSQCDSLMVCCAGSCSPCAQECTDPVCVDGQTCIAYGNGCTRCGGADSTLCASGAGGGNGGGGAGGGGGSSSSCTSSASCGANQCCSAGACVACQQLCSGTVCADGSACVAWGNGCSYCRSADPGLTCAP